MMTGDQNYRLLQEIQANRLFLLAAYRQNPKLLERAETRIREMFDLNPPNPPFEKRDFQRGISLIELIMFIVIISIGVAGILLVMNQVTGHSADTLVRKQALAIAESMLEEVELQDFTKPAVGGFPGPFTAANRASFDCVKDYSGFSTNGIFSVANSSISGLGSYKVSVAVTDAALGTIAAGSAVLVTVTVTDPQNNNIKLSGYRTAY